ncbi:MAG: tyrosine--tRNA ligase [Gammaproteobacteria bacterium]|nr:tyrosine--tRNA ligase [Gammaproteobacteria bacterium]
MESSQEQFKELSRGTDEILIEQDFQDLLALSRPLRIKAGFDPTAPDLHLGHTVLLNKMRQFQNLGHEVIFLIGDFTALIGDPSGRSVLRPALSKEEITNNSSTYNEQVFKILDKDKTIIEFNSNWMNKFNASDLIKLASKQTVARMLERDDFDKRFKSGKPISIHEFIYPIVQGYDSVALRSDIELGGTDQKFNLLMGRHIQQSFQQDPQVIITLPLLKGLDGEKKMSKSLNNFIGITDTPKEIFGKVMSISDSLMWSYFELLSFKSISEIDTLKSSVESGKNPRDVKYQLAEELVERFYNSQTAIKAKKEFIELFRQGSMPSDMPQFKLELTSDGIGIRHLLKNSGLVGSSSEALRMIKQGAVKLNGENISDFDLFITPNFEGVFQVGKRRFKKIILSKK